MKFRKKPVVIEAVQWTGVNIAEIRKFMQPNYPLIPNFNTPKWSVKGHRFLVIETLEGDHRANPKDWIIKGVKGEFYPCKPDIFQQTYEPVLTSPKEKEG